MSEDINSAGSDPLVRAAALRAEHFAALTDERRQADERGLKDRVKLIDKELKATAPEEAEPVEPVDPPEPVDPARTATESKPRQTRA